MRCLVTGATGYIGGRLAPRLLDEGHDVRCMTRSASRLSDVPWADRVEVVEADALDEESLGPALDGVDVAYYLIHSIDTGAKFSDTDRKAAQSFARAAKAAGVGRLVYLGGLSPDDEELSEHLRSRNEVAEIMLGSGVPTAVLRAAVIIGSGSASFEMLRYLTERLPVMVTPKWVRTRIQPIAIGDVLRYLIGAATLPPDVSREFDIAGPDVLTYGEMMQRYARVAGLRRRVVIPVPLLTPRLSSHWVHVVTPVPDKIARPLVQSLQNEVVAHERDIARYVPDPPGGLTGLDRAIELALAKVKDTADADAGDPWHGAPSDALPTDPDWAGGSLYADERTVTVGAPPAAVWRVLDGLGGAYPFPPGWRLRGRLDRLIGGPGLRRRRDPDHLAVGDPVGYWRVEDVVAGEQLTLRGELRLPGLARLELRVGTEDGRTVYTQRALFQPRGLSGHAYWWAIRPLHSLALGRMARDVTAAA